MKNDLRTVWVVVMLSSLFLIDIYITNAWMKKVERRLDWSQNNIYELQEYVGDLLRNSSIEEIGKNCVEGVVVSGGVRNPYNATSTVSVRCNDEYCYPVFCKM